MGDFIYQEIPPDLIRASLNSFHDTDSLGLL